VKELHGYPTVGPRPKVFGPEVKNGSSAKDGAPERLKCGTIQEEVSLILQRVSASAANVSPPQRGGTVPAPLERGGPRW